MTAAKEGDESTSLKRYFESPSHDDLSTTFHSDSSIVSFRADSIDEQKRGGQSQIKASLLRQPKPQTQKSALKAYMEVWGNFKPRTEGDSLPFDKILTTNNPLMAMSQCNLKCEKSYSNLLALFSNAMRREIADMDVYILPSLLERTVDGLSPQECQELEEWWFGFARFTLTLLTTVAQLLEKMFSSCKSKLSKLPTAQCLELQAEYKRSIERLTITSELPMKAMNDKIQELESDNSNRAFLDVEEMWSCLSKFLLKTLHDSHILVQKVEDKTGKKMSSGTQAKIIQHMLVAPPSEHGDTKQSHAANMTISLTRWMHNEKVVMQWTKRFLKRRIVRQMEHFVVLYAELRKISKFQFERRPSSKPRKTRNSPPKVTFNLTS